MLFTMAGLQVPVIPLTDVAGNVGTIPLLQMLIAIGKLNVGVMLGATVTTKTNGVAHGSTGVKVYESEV